MKQKVGALIIISVLFQFSCSKDTETAFALSMREVLLQKDSVVFLVGFNEQLPENKQPVSLGFGISTIQTFPDALILVSNASVKNGNIILNIETIKNSGKCPDYMLYSSSSFPSHNLLKRECAAYGNCALYNLPRGNYQLEFIFMGRTISRGTLFITDNQAALEIKGDLVQMLDEKINIVPDSCIFGNYFPTNQFSVESFRKFLSEIKSTGCREVVLAPGSYRRFSAGKDGLIAGERSFIFKTRNNFEEITSFMREYLKTHPEIHGFIFEDSYGRYYNVKR